MTTVDPILINLVRKVLPQVIAQDIVGAQPMTVPSGVFGKGTSVTKFPRDGAWMSKEKLNNFLRLNNRRKTHSREELKAAGYPSVYVQTGIVLYNYAEHRDWLNANLPNQHFWPDSFNLFFSEEKYKMMYLLRWS